MTDRKLVGDTLRLCRQFFGLSQGELGEIVGTSRQFIHQLETEFRSPNELTARALSAALNVDISFLEKNLIGKVHDEDCHFRKLRTTPKWLVKQVTSHATVASQIIAFLEDYVDLPPVNVPNIHVDAQEDIENVAKEVRLYWGLTKNEPILNVARALEANGVVIIGFPSLSAKLDALSVDRRRPLIIRSNYKESPTRFRFDMAHECGHLVMHQGLETGDHHTESQADRFASAFLLPREVMLRNFPVRSRLPWESIIYIKKKWKVSLQAIIRRAYDLDLLTAPQYKRAMINISKRGFRKNEPYEPSDREEGEVLSIAFDSLRENYGITRSRIERELGIKRAMLNRFVPEDSEIDEGNMTGSNVISI